MALFCLLWPSTRLSKSPVSPLLSSRPFTRLGARLDMKSERFAAAELVAPSSCNFRVCSCSIRDEMDLMRAMKDWNCCRLRSGPRLMDHRIGNPSMARKSGSAILATSLKTSREAT